MALTKQEKVLAIIRDVDRIDIRNLHAQYKTQYGEELSKSYMERCIELLKESNLIASVKRGVYQTMVRYQEDQKREQAYRAIVELCNAMSTRATAPRRILTTREIPFVYWYRVLGFGTKGEERVVIIPAGTLGVYDANTDMYKFALPGSPVAYRRRTVAQFRGFFEVAG